MLEELVNRGKLSGLSEEDARALAKDALSNAHLMESEELFDSMLRAIAIFS